MTRLAVAVCGFLLGFAAVVVAAPVDNTWYRSGDVHFEGVVYAGSSGIALTNATGNLASTTGSFSGAVSTGALTVTGAASATTSVSAGTLFIDGTTAAVAAAGSSKTDCAALTTGKNLSTSGASLTGVCLPAASAGKSVVFENGTSVTQIVYPKDSDDAALTVHPLAALGTDAGWTVGPGGSLSCTAYSATSWRCTMTFGATASVAATSSGQSGTALAAVNLGSYVMVTGADGTKTVTLPAGTNLGCIRIYSQVSTAVFIIVGNTSDDDTINGGSADAAQNFGASANFMICTINGVAWQVY